MANCAMSSHLRRRVSTHSNATDNDQLPPVPLRVKGFFNERARISLLVQQVGDNVLYVSLHPGILRT
jgi:hypothetical protein